MKTAGLFNQTISMLERALDLRTRKHSLVSSNLANSDTPGYKPFTLMVEEEMQKTADKKNQLPLLKTQATHLQSPRTNNDHIKTVRRASSGYSLRGDGNEVDVDVEMTDMARNQLMYSASAQLISRKLRGLKEVIKGN